MSRAARAAGLLAGLALLATACFGSREPVPPAVDAYFTALRDGDFAAAYELTDLPAFGSAPGFALSRAHFLAFHQRNPLQDYRVLEVFRQEARDTIASEGRPFFTVDVELTYGFGVSRQSVFLEGRVLPKIQIEPAAILFARSDGFPSTIFIDGVRTRVALGNERVALTVLAGEHDVAVGARDLRVATSPLAVVNGPARIDPGPPEVVRLT